MMGESLCVEGCAPLKSRTNSKSLLSRLINLNAGLKDESFSIKEQSLHVKVDGYFPTSTIIDFFQSLNMVAGPRLAEPLILRSKFSKNPIIIEAKDVSNMWREVSRDDLWEHCRTGRQCTIARAPNGPNDIVRLAHVSGRLTEKSLSSFLSEYDLIG